MNTEASLLVEFIAQLPNLTLNGVALIFLWFVWKELQRFITFTMQLVERDRAERELMAEALGLDYRSLVVQGRERMNGRGATATSADEDTRELYPKDKIVRRDTHGY